MWQILQFIYFIVHLAQAFDCFRFCRSCHHAISVIFRFSMPRSSTLSIVARRCLPGSNGRETVPRQALIRLSSISALRLRASFAQPPFHWPWGRRPGGGRGCGRRSRGKHPRGDAARAAGLHVVGPGTARDGKRVRYESVPCCIPMHPTRRRGPGQNAILACRPAIAWLSSKPSRTTVRPAPNDMPSVGV